MNDYILDEIRQAVAQRDRLDKQIYNMVDAALREGHSWKQIALALGAISPFAARQRYDPHCPVCGELHPEPVTHQPDLSSSGPT